MIMMTMGNIARICAETTIEEVEDYDLLPDIYVYTYTPY